MNSFFYISLFCALPVTTLAQNGEQAGLENRMTYFYSDFEKGIDAGFQTYDLDGQTLHFTMKQAGFEQGDAFVAMREKRVAKENHFVGSTSKYKYAKDEEHHPSNDWLVTPNIWIRGERAVLSWRGKSVCDQKKNTSGYKVLVSTSGNRPEDFKEVPVFEVANESADEWVNHEVALDAYVGKKVYIAFLNDNLDKEILALDDIRVEGEKGLCDFVVKTGRYEYGKDVISVDCAVTAFSDVPVTSVTAHYAYQGKTFTKEMSNLSLKKHETVNFSFDETIPVACGDTVNYEVWAEVNGVEFEKENCQTISFLFNPHRRTVIEEGTGMWCGYCPKGTVAMETLAEKYPNDFIGIAIHYDDPMEVKDYRLAMDFPSFPSGRINRKYLTEEPMVLVEEEGKKKYTTLSGGFETLFQQAQQEQTLADISLEAAVEGDEVKAKATTRFAVARQGANYQIAFVVVEDSVSDSKYYQTNYFAGGDTEVGGYEKLPARIIDPGFNHVARGVYADYQGVPASVPADIRAGETNVFEYAFPLPTAVKNKAHVKIVALLVDGVTGEIVNANVAKSEVTGVASVVKEQMGLSYRKDGGMLRVDFASPSASPVTIQLYTSSGERIACEVVSQVKGMTTLNLPLKVQRGGYVVLATQDGLTKAMKVIL